MRIFFCTGLLFVSVVAFAQDTTRSFGSKGRLYGQFFGDYFYKGHADSLARGYYQYSGLPKNDNAFQIRRLQLGYQYDFNASFTANVLLESFRKNDQLTFFIKYANLRWKGIWPGTDLVFGRMRTPTFSTLTDKVWNYRSIERSIADMQGSPSYDLGVALQGEFDKSGRFGYTLMAGNGSGTKIADDRFKKFYGELYAKLDGKRLVFDVYGDYERLRWQPGFHQATYMLKAFAAYQTDALTIGLEAYTQYLQNSITRRKTTGMDTLSVRNAGLSSFIHGKIWSDRLGFFARLDYFNPFTGLEAGSAHVASLLPEYDPVNRNRFITAGLDYTPTRQIHFMPNIWYCRYQSRTDPSRRDYDLVYRLTLFYKFEG